MQNTNDPAKLLFNLPTTLTDYLRFCKNNDFQSIRLTSEMIANIESKLVHHKPAEIILNEGFRLIISEIQHSENPQISLLESFAKVCSSFGAKRIFLGFLSQKAKYIEGAIIPIGDDETALIYLPIPPNPVIVLYSTSVYAEKIMVFAKKIVVLWKNIIARSLKMKVAT